jgi:SecD/SecF fusion protein
LIWRSLFVATVIGVSVYLVVDRPVRLGLDLRGGTQIVLEAQDTELETVDADTVARTVEVLRRRVDQLGVSEPSLQASGDRRVIVELPGVSDPDEALEVIGQTAQLNFHEVLGVPEGEAPEDEPADGDGNLILTDEDGGRIRVAPAALTGDVVSDAEAFIDTLGSSSWTVSIEFRGEGGDQWADITGAAACEPAGSPQRRVAIALDQEVITSPQVGADVECDVGITGGDTVITGDFTEKEAKDLALLIRAGALPVPVEVVERRTIGPTLGDAAVDASVQAALIGGALTLLYVIGYYRLLGILAAVALLLYGLISYAVLLALGATLTLPGIAGFVLAIGMAVDANVLVFERSKEEFSGGKRLRASVMDGFKKAWSAIADSNATTVLAAIILFFFATGAVRGFGITLTVGVAVSMFTALVITRLFADLLLRSKGIQKRPALLGMNVGGKLRQRLEERPINIMGRRKIWFALSAVVLAASIGGLVVRGLNYGLEFTGGRLVEYETAQEVDLDEMRAELADAGFPRAVVQESGSGNVSVRAGELTEDDEATIEAAIIEVGGSAEKVRDEFIGPTIGEELRRQALIALGLGLTAQLLYLAVRFRWTYGSSAVLTLAHDVLILLGVFAWLGKDIDGVFIAALLTTIGYSINDSVVVFDRIRERRAARSRESLEQVANDACLQTIPRTINTGIGALFILLALYFLGGETLTDFALALIVGIVVGTYSSVFTAAPMLLVFEGLAGEDKSLQPSAREAAFKRTKDKALAAAASDGSAGGSTSGEPAVNRPPPRKAAGAAKRKRRKR